MKTHDTRPEAPSAAGPVPRALHNLPTAMVFTVLVVGVVGVTVDHWRKGAQVIGGAPLLAALFRLVLPAREAGPLVIRSRAFDVLVLGLAGAAVVALATVVPTYYHHHL